MMHVQRLSEALWKPRSLEKPANNCVIPLVNPQDHDGPSHDQNQRGIVHLHAIEIFLRIPSVETFPTIFKQCSAKNSGVSRKEIFLVGKYATVI